MANDWNTKLIEEFRADEGKLSGPFAGRDLLLLNTTGAKSGQPRTSPVAFIRDGDRLVIVASKAGAPTNPDWYHNLLANPQVTLELGTETIRATATPITEGPERDRLYAAMAETLSSFADYEQKTSRVIPVVILEPSA